MASTTSCEVGPAGLSIRIAPSSAENSCIKIKSTRRRQGFLDRRNDFALHGQGIALDARARRRRMTAAAELRRDFTDVHIGAFGAKTDAGQIWLNLLKDAGH